MCLWRCTVDSRDTERSPTSPQESGAAVPLTETHNSKVSLSPSEEQLDIKTRWKLSCFCDPCCSAVIQLMAAAKARRGLAFFTFKDESLEYGLQQSYRLLRTEGTTVGECSAQRLTSQAESHLIMFEITHPQRNCTTSWRTTALSSIHLAPSTWNCLTSSKTATFVQKNLPRVCSEPQQKAFSVFSYLTLASLTHADWVRV